jgi:hypothetical protein
MIAPVFAFMTNDPNWPFVRAGQNETDVRTDDQEVRLAVVLRVDRECRTRSATRSTTGRSC